MNFKCLWDISRNLKSQTAEGSRRVEEVANRSDWDQIWGTLWSEPVTAAWVQLQRSAVFLDLCLIIRLRRPAASIRLLKPSPLAAMGNHGSNLDDILAEDMHHWYNKFMRESPSGLITLFELKAILNLKGITENANSYVEQVFFTFDMDGDGYIDFVEYIAAVSLLLKGEINQKLKWYFKLFDQDGNGKIDKDELETIFTAIQDITRNRDIDPEEIVTLIYERIDVKGEGELTLEEFIDGAKEHPDIMDMLKNLMDLTPVLEIIVKGRQPAIQD
ncbi:hypothetical protein CRENBAI_020863 [Crenichthys baileyi]|uniref:EF-hand domain-containing protein n=4 Tax=Goodeidae TaxID=28758 RepID=A0AAV9S9Y9_9TELE